MRDIAIVAANIFGVFILFLICTACTMNIVISHSQGANNDVDADPTSQADIKPELSLTSPIPGLG